LGGASAASCDATLGAARLRAGYGHLTGAADRVSDEARVINAAQLTPSAATEPDSSVVSGKGSNTFAVDWQTPIGNHDVNRIAIGSPSGIGRPHMTAYNSFPAIAVGPADLTSKETNRTIDGNFLVPPAGLEPAISCVKGRRPNH
jgi:hypothetical protein